MDEREWREWRTTQAILRKIEKAIHSIYEKYNAERSGNQPPERIIIAPGSELPPPASEYYAAESKDRPEHTFWERARLALEIGAFIAAVIAALLTFSTLQQVRRQADAASKQLKFSTESFRMEQRAFVEISRVYPVKAFPRDAKNSAFFLYEFRLKNAGKTVARNVRVKAANPSGGFDLSSNAYALDLWQNDKFKDAKTGGPANVLRVNSFPTVIAPDSETPLSFRFGGTEPRYGSWYQFFLGRIDYVSVFGIPHWTKFCMYVSDSSGDLRYCEAGNDEDNNPETPPQK